LFCAHICTLWSVFFKIVIIISFGTSNCYVTTDQTKFDLRMKRDITQCSVLEGTPILGLQRHEKLTLSPLWSPKVLKWCTTFYNLTVQNFTCFSSVFTVTQKYWRTEGYSMCISKPLSHTVISELKLC
jgi:hypothetical protein